MARTMSSGQRSSWSSSSWRSGESAASTKSVSASSMRFRLGRSSPAPPKWPAGCGVVVAVSVMVVLTVGRGRGGGTGRCGVVEVGSDRAQQHLGDVEHLDGLAGGPLHPALRDAVGEHGHAERAGGGDEVGGEREGLVGAVEVDPGAEVLVHPHPRPAGAAAERLLPVPRHLGEGEARDRTEHLARGGEDPVVPAEVAGVVVGDRLGDRDHRDEPSVGDEPGEQGRVVDHLVVAADLRVLVAQGVEAVRAGDDDAAWPRPR